MAAVTSRNTLTAKLAKVGTVGHNFGQLGITLDNVQTPTLFKGVN